MTSKYTWILDPGHGGLGPGGEYLTPGKRSPEVPPGVYEGAFNRIICENIVEFCPNITTTITNPGPVNAGLKERVEYINGLQKVRKNCILLSIHANAIGRKPFWSSANGAVVFHHPASKAGKQMAKWFLDSFNHHTHIDVTRGVKSARFTVLSKTRKQLPGVLIECGFMTNKHDAKYMASKIGQYEIAFAIAETIKNFEGGKLFID